LPGDEQTTEVTTASLAVRELLGVRYAGDRVQLVITAYDTGLVTPAQ
jgi:hypothetical protein